MNWAENTVHGLPTVHIKWFSSVKDQPQQEFFQPAKVFLQICSWSSFPEMDVMAASVTCMACLSWKNIKAHVFPPFPLIMRILNTVLENQATVIVVLSFWPCRVWFPLVLKLSRGAFWEIPPCSNLLSQRGLHNLKLEMIHLMAWSLTDESDRQNPGRQRSGDLFLKTIYH